MKKNMKKFAAFVLLCALFAAALPEASMAVYADDTKKEEILFPGAGGVDACSLSSTLICR